MKPTDRPEREIVRAILDYLRLEKIPAWRNNTGAVQEGRRFIRFGPKGGADILGVLPPDGRFLALEVKRPGRHATQEQQAFLDWVDAAGGIGEVVTSIQDVRLVLARVAR